MVNKVILVGNVGRDPEVRYTPSGQAVATFTVATSRRWKDKNGQRQEQTEWHTVVVWGASAENVGQYVTKGRQIYVDGRLQTRSWDDKNSGEKRYKTEVVCDTFQLLGQRPEGDGSARATPPGAGPAYDGFGLGGGDDDDIPFTWTGALPVLLPWLAGVLGVAS